MSRSAKHAYKTTFARIKEKNKDMLARKRADWSRAGLLTLTTRFLAIASHFFLIRIAPPTLAVSKIEKSY